MAEIVQMHATCVDLNGGGVLLRGPSGSGKSDLALRLIDGGARLVADDRVDLRVESGRLTAHPPEALAGLLEVRGLGLIRLPHLESSEVVLLIDLVAPPEVPRLPEPVRENLLGFEIVRLALAAHEASAPAKVRVAAMAAHNPAICHSGAWSR